MKESSPLLAQELQRLESKYSTEDNMLFITPAKVKEDSTSSLSRIEYPKQELQKVHTSKLRADMPRDSRVTTLLNKNSKLKLKSKGFLKRTREESRTFMQSKVDNKALQKEQNIKDRYQEKIKAYDNLQELVGSSLPLLTPRRVLNLKSNVSIFIDDLVGQ